MARGCPPAWEAGGVAVRWEPAALLEGPFTAGDLWEGERNGPQGARKFEGEGPGVGLEGGGRDDEVGRGAQVVNNTL